MRIVVAVAALLLVPGLAGCVEKDAADAHGPEAGVAYMCEGQVLGAPCLERVAPPGQRFYEPAAGAHPDRRGVYVVAATRIGGATESATGNLPGEEAADLCRVFVHVTLDNGTSWRQQDPELLPWGLVEGMPVRDRCTRSPDITIDGAGNMHLVVNDFVRSWTASATGIADPSSQFKHRVLYLRSSDNGASWVAKVLREDANHPHIAYDASTGTLVATVRGLEGDGFSSSAVTWSVDGGTSWQEVVPVACHLPTRPGFLDGHALFGCTDHKARSDGKVIRIFSLGLSNGSVEARAEVPVAGAKNLYTALAVSADGHVAVAWVPTIPGGAVEGDPFLAVADGCCGFGPAANLREAFDPETRNGIGVDLRWDSHGALHAGIEGYQGEEDRFVHIVIEKSGAVQSATLVKAWTWRPRDATDPDEDPAEALFGAWRGSAYPAFAFQAEGGLLATTSNAESELNMARLVFAGET